MRLEELTHFLQLAFFCCVREGVVLPCTHLIYKTLPKSCAIVLQPRLHRHY